MKNYLSTILLIILILVSYVKYAPAQQIELHYSLINDTSNSTVVVDESDNANDGTLLNGAIVTDYYGVPVIDLGENDGYVDLGSSFGDVVSGLGDFSVYCEIFIPQATSLSSYGNFVWTFANSTDISSDANGCLFFSAKNTRYAISPTHWQSESGIETGEALEKGVWKTVAYIEEDGEGSLYIDGELALSGTIDMTPSELGTTPYNFIGRSCYSSDVYLENAKFADFRIYSGAISVETLSELHQSIEPYNRITDSILVSLAISEIGVENGDSVKAALALLSTVGEGVSVEWSSSDNEIISADGIVFRPAAGNNPVAITLTATLTHNSYSTTTSVDVIVIPEYSDSKSVEFDLAGIQISGNTANARSSIGLPFQTTEGSNISWSSDSPGYINSVGKVLKLSPTGEGKKEVILTATVSKGEITATKDFTVYVAEDEGKSAYLFTYFTGNTVEQEQIRFALSNDGLDYTPLNEGEPVISSSDIALTGSVRDPHIMLAEDGSTYYMVVTDMKSSDGWASNRGIVLLKSTNLVNWTHATVHFPTKWPSAWANVTRVWAPQTIYDPVAEKYMVYFSLLTDDGTCPYDKIYYCYANSDFTDLETDPVYLFDRGSATIDGDIVFNESDSLYHLFYKNEGQGGICQVTGKTLTAQAGEEDGSQWENPSGTLQQTTEAVEGSGVFRLINKDEWILMYDCYGSGHYQYCSSADLDSFTYVQDNYSIGARHGTTISITEEEANRLAEAFPSTALSDLVIGARNNNIKESGIEINSGANTIEIPVCYGTDSADFDPMFYATPGTVISPSGVQDFSTGSVSYSFTFDEETTNYDVSIKVYANPVIPDFHADPEILYSKKTGLFYIYSTTDGYSGWGGYYFDVFSSPDLVNWINEGTILDLSTSQVSWATGNAWAPCIEEKEIADGVYRYYFYFSGESDGKKIGVAISDSPTGPFVDSGEPMISDLPDGVSSGQQIDGDVFTDPVSGNSYFYWGNGYMAGAQLNEDMTSIDESTITVLTPSGGTLDTYAYREGTYVFYRNGKYYFVWSVDDTGAENYHVAYGTADNPMGPIEVADQPIVIIQDAANEIYGTGHNSVLQIPDTDIWYIVYHRINAEYLDNGPGYHREVCIDRLYFDDDGKIETITPTHRGIDPVLFTKGDTTSSIEVLIDTESQKKNGGLISRQYFNLMGQNMGDNLGDMPGVYIRVDKYENGYIESGKIINTGVY